MSSLLAPQSKVFEINADWADYADSRFLALSPKAQIRGHPHQTQPLAGAPLFASSRRSPDGSRRTMKDAFPRRYSRPRTSAANTTRDRGNVMPQTSPDRLKKRA